MMLESIAIAIFCIHFGLHIAIVVKAIYVFKVEKNVFSLWLDSAAVLVLLYFFIFSYSRTKNRDLKSIDRIKKTAISIRALPILISVAIENIIVKREIYRKVYKNEKQKGKRFFEKEAKEILNSNMVCFSHR